MSRPEAEAEEKAKAICTTIAERDQRAVFVEKVEAYPHVFTILASSLPGKIRVDERGKPIPSIQYRDFSRPPP